MADNVIVTGSRIQSPALAAPQGFETKTAERNPAADPAYAAFLSRLQSAVRSGDHRAMIGLIAFPLRVNTAGRTRLYRDAGSVERNFDRIFTARVRQAILAQRADRLLVRDLGATVGNGEIWFDRSCANPTCSPPGPVRIISVNP
jgi:hypothetical protein